MSRQKRQLWRQMAERVGKNLYTTVGGIVAGGLAGAALTVQSGQLTQEAIIAGAAIGAAGALLKDPRFVRRGSDTPDA